MKKYDRGPGNQESEARYESPFSLNEDPGTWNNSELSLKSLKSGGEGGDSRNMILGCSITESKDMKNVKKKIAITN